MESANVLTGELVDSSPTTLVVPTAKDKSVVEATAEANAYIQSVTAMVIDSSEMYDLAADELGRIAGALKALEEKRQTIARPLHQAWTATNALFKPAQEAGEKAKAILSSKMLDYTKAERAKREAAEKLAAEQAAAARAEAQATLEATRAAAQAGVVTEAEVLEAETAVAVAEVATPIAPVAAPVAKGGHSTRVRYVATVTDLAALLRHLADKIAAGGADREWAEGVVELKLGALNTLGTSSKGAVAIPGVRWDKDEKLAARAR